MAKCVETSCLYYRASPSQSTLAAGGLAAQRLPLSEELPDATNARFATSHRSDAGGPRSPPPLPTPPPPSMRRGSPVRTRRLPTKARSIVLRSVVRTGPDAARRRVAPAAAPQMRAKLAAGEPRSGRSAERAAAPQPSTCASSHIFRYGQGHAARVPWLGLALGPYFSGLEHPLPLPALAGGLRGKRNKLAGEPSRRASFKHSIRKFFPHLFHLFISSFKLKL